MKKRINLLGILCLSLLVSACSMTQPKDGEYELTIVHVNDMHGRVKEGKYDGVGVARVATITKALEQNKNNGKVLLVDAGDTYHGTTFATLAKGESIVNVLNTAGFDYSTLGNHDFNYGTDRLKELINLGEYKTLAANVVDKATGKPFTNSYDIIDIGWDKVGIFGLATPETAFKTNPKNIESIEFLNPIETAKKVVSELKKENVDFIIAITHLGNDAETSDELKSKTLAQEVPEINLIIDGHSHDTLSEKMMIGDVAIVQTGEYNKNVGVAKIDLDKLNSKANSIDYSLYTKDIILNGDNPVVEDSTVKATIDQISLDQQKITDTIIGSTPFTLEGSRDVVRRGESNLAQLITDSILAKTGADIAITNGGGIRATIPAGDITIGDVITVLPFGNYVITKELLGSDILAAIEHGLKDYPNSSGAMIHIAGATVEVNPNNPEFRRVKKVFIDGQELDLNKTYVVATNDFMAAGGDEYTSLAGGKELSHYPGLDEILIEYIQTNGVTGRESISPRIITNK